MAGKGKTRGERNGLSPSLQPVQKRGEPLGKGVGADDRGRTKASPENKGSLPKKKKGHSGRGSRTGRKSFGESGPVAGVVWCTYSPTV